MFSLVWQKWTHWIEWALREQSRSMLFSLLLHCPKYMGSNFKFSPHHQCWLLGVSSVSENSNVCFISITDDLPRISTAVLVPPQIQLPLGCRLPRYSAEVCIGIRPLFASPLEWIRTTTKATISSCFPKTLKGHAHNIKNQTYMLPNYLKWPQCNMSDLFWLYQNKGIYDSKLAILMLLFFDKILKKQTWMSMSINTKCDVSKCILPGINRGVKHKFMGFSGHPRPSPCLCPFQSHCWREPLMRRDA